jgi:hypothetical protein
LGEPIADSDNITVSASALVRCGAEDLLTKGDAKNKSTGAEYLCTLRHTARRFLKRGERVSLRSGACQRFFGASGVDFREKKRF